MQINRLSNMTALMAMLILAACAAAVTSIDITQASTPIPNTSTPSMDATPLPGNLDQVTFIEDGQTYTIRQLISRDGIMPIYDPQFTSAEDSGYDSNELVMGVEINGDARAYPVGLLQQREMVNDTVGGVPIVATW